MQQRAKNVVPRQPKKVHWDYLLDEAGWLRRDFREERVWRMGEAKKMAGECLKAWMLRVEERGRFVEDEDVTGSELGYRREGARDGDVGWEGDFAVRTRVSGEGSGGDVLGKRKWDAASEGGEDVQGPLKRPRTLRRFSCHVDDSI
jgi:HSA